MTAALPSGLDLDQVDAAARPQDDLFGHVNGRWLAEHVMPADRSSDGAFHALRDLSEERVREIVEEAADDVARTVDETGSLPVPTTDHARIGTLYRMFMDTEAIEAAGLSGLADLLDEIGATRDLEGLVRRMAAPDSGASAVLAYVWTDDHDSSQYQVKIHQGGLGLPDESYYREEHHAETREAYAAHLANLARLAELPGRAGLAAGGPEELARAVLDFETRLAACHVDVVRLRDREKSDNPMDAAQRRELAAERDRYHALTDPLLEGATADQIRDASAQATDQERTQRAQQHHGRQGGDEDLQVVGDGEFDGDEVVAAGQPGEHHPVVARLAHGGDPCIALDQCIGRAIGARAHRATGIGVFAAPFRQHAAVVDEGPVSAPAAAGALQLADQLHRWLVAGREPGDRRGVATPDRTHARLLGGAREIETGLGRLVVEHEGAGEHRARLRRHGAGLAPVLDAGLVHHVSSAARRRAPQPRKRGRRGSPRRRARSSSRLPGGVLEPSGDVRDPAEHGLQPVGGQLLEPWTDRDHQPRQLLQGHADLADRPDDRLDLARGRRRPGQALDQVRQQQAHPCAAGHARLARAAGGTCGGEVAGVHHAGELLRVGAVDQALQVEVALLAQRMLHHKSRKRSYQAVFWIVVALNVSAVVAWPELAG